jgi:hypothetical protein
MGEHEEGVLKRQNAWRLEGPTLLRGWVGFACSRNGGPTAESSRGLWEKNLFFVHL